MQPVRIEHPTSGDVGRNHRNTRERRKEWAIVTEGGEERRSASGGGTGRIDLVEEVERLDDEDEEDRVRVGL